MSYYALPLITSTSAFSEIVTRLANNAYISNDPVGETFRNLILLPQGYGAVTTAVYDQIPPRQPMDNDILCKGLMGIFAILRVLNLQDLESFKSASNFRRDPVKELLNSLMDLPEEYQNNLAVILPIVSNALTNLVYLENRTPKYFARNVDGERQGIGSPTGKFTIGTTNINASGKSCGSFYYTRYVHRPAFGDHTKSRSNHALIRSPIGVRYITPTHALLGAWLSSIRYSGYLPAAIARYNIITTLTYMQRNGISISSYRRFVFPNGVLHSLGKELQPALPITGTNGQPPTDSPVYTLTDIIKVITDKAKRIPIDTLDHNLTPWSPLKFTSPFNDVVVETPKLTVLGVGSNEYEVVQLSDPETMGSVGGDHPVVCIPGGDENVSAFLVNIVSRIPKLVDYLVSGFFLIGMHEGSTGVGQGSIRVFTYYGRGVSLQIILFSRDNIAGVPEGILVVEYLPEADPIFHTI